MIKGQCFETFYDVTATMDKLQLAGQNLGRVFNFRSSHLHATHLLCFHVKLPDLKVENSAQTTYTLSPVRYRTPQCYSWRTLSQYLRKCAARCKNYAEKSFITLPSMSLFHKTVYSLNYAFSNVVS
jgi:hypothetical protein